VSVYLDGATVQECRDALRQGVQIEVLAGRVQLPADVLERLVVLHSPVVRVRADPSMIEIDLWHDSTNVL
jgi:hypothetical protein